MNQFIRNEDHRASFISASLIAALIPRIMRMIQTFTLWWILPRLTNYMIYL